MNLCCERMEDAARRGRIEVHEYVGGYDIPGCCGGGCYVLHDLDYCPFCGTKLLAREGVGAELMKQDVS